MNSKTKRIGSKNAFERTFDNGAVILISYATPVACYIPALGYMETEEKFSRTTSRQIAQWKRDQGYTLSIRVPQHEIEGWMEKLDRLNFGEQV